jgi:integrase-like protein
VRMSDPLSSRCVANECRNVWQPTRLARPAFRPASVTARWITAPGSVCWVGERVKRTKKAWETCVLRAHGHEPQWAKNGKLSQESRAALRMIDLRFHDLRHEAGSRWLEAGWSIHQVKEMLGHANISQTDTYLNVGRMRLHESMKRFDDVRCKIVASQPPIEHKLPRNDDQHDAGKDLLH